jgi:hypothetical protein
LKKALALLLVIMCIVMLAQGQANIYTERIRNAFPDIRFDLIRDDWQNDPYLKSYLEQRLLLIEYAHLSVLKNQATKANDTALINKYGEQMYDFFIKNINDFKKLDTLLDSCLIHSNSELLLALLLQNWENINPKKIELVSENLSDLLRKSYYGKIFKQQLKNRSKKLTKRDFVYGVLNIMPDWEIVEVFKMKLEYNLLNDHIINVLVVELYRQTKNINEIYNNKNATNEVFSHLSSALFNIQICFLKQTVSFDKRVKNAFPDIRFDLIEEDWQNDPYLKPYLEQRLFTIEHDRLSALKNEATKANDTVHINKYFKEMNAFFNENADEFIQLSILLDSCIIHSNSELLLALLLQNWDNTDQEKLKLVDENLNEVRRNSYYGKIFSQKLQMRLLEMTKIDYIYLFCNTMGENWDTGSDIKLKLEYNLLDDEIINILVITFKRGIDKTHYVIVEQDILDTINNILYFETVSQPSAELQSVRELLYLY